MIEKELNQSQRERKDTTIPSPYRSNRQTYKDLSPLRMKTPVKPCAVAAAVAKPSSRRDVISPKSPLSRQINFKSEASPLDGKDLSQVRAARSPYKCEMAKQEEGDASLIYLTRDAFKEFLAIEGGLEAAKKELVIRHDFTLAGAFSKFSDNTHGRVTANELLFGLEKLGIACDIHDARLIVDRYDADKDGKLGFWEFSNALLPIQPGLRDEIERKRAIWDISAETLDILKKTFRHLLDAEAMIEGIRQRL